MTNYRDSRKITPLELVLSLALVIFTVGLTLYALNGRFVRFWADDYAYTLVARGGLINGTHEWYVFNGARLSSFWFVSFIDLFGMNAVRILPALTIILWVVSISWFTRQLMNLLGVKVSWLLINLTSVLLVYFSVLLMPTRLETLYWRMGTLHYTLPIPMTFINLALILSFASKKQSTAKNILLAVGVMFIAFIAGAHGEASGALLVGYYLLAICLVWLLNTRKKMSISYTPMLFALAGSLLAIFMMAASPANKMRMEAMPPPTSLANFIYYTLRYSLDFVVDSVKTQPLPNLVFIVASITVSLVLLQSVTCNLRTRAAFLLLAVSVAVTFGLMVFSVSPSVFAGQYYPAPRALMPGRFAILSGMMVVSFFAAVLMRNWFSGLTNAHWGLIIMIALVFVSVYTVRSFGIPIAEGRNLAVKAELWDKQDAAIKAAKLAGIDDVVIPQYDVVDSLISFFEDSSHWINQSAAKLYGVKSITAKP